MRRIALSLFAAMLFVPVSLWGQSSRPFELGIGGGITFVTGDDRDFYKDGFHLQGSVGLDIPVWGLAARLDVMYHKLPGKDVSDQTVPGAPDTLFVGDFSTIAGALSALYYLTAAETSVRPYINFGIGLYFSEQDAVKYEQPVSGSSTDFGLVGGLGLRFGLGPLSAFAEARIHNIFGDGGSAQIYPLTIGAMF